MPSTTKMKMRRLTAMISTLNDYSILKWPLTITSVLITVLALLLLLGFRSENWFKFEVVEIHTKMITSNTSQNISDVLRHGSFGLWKYCSNNVFDRIVQCDTYTRESRPEYFSLILILVSCALFIVNLAIFPSWVATILVLYNTNNRYIAYLVASLWIMFLFTLVIAILLICVMMFVGASSFYSPGKISSSGKQTIYHSGSGIFLIFSSTILSLVCLLAIIITLIWKKFIDVKLDEAEKELYRQLVDDNFQPGWHKVIKIPRMDTKLDNYNDGSYSPPPYHDDSKATNK